MAYAHYSFDLWMTLIRSNPQYKYERARVIRERYNPAGRTLEEVVAVFRQVDLLANTINERTGRQLRAEELYLWVIGLAAGPLGGIAGPSAGAAISDTAAAEAIAGINPDGLYDEMEAVALAYPPQIYEAATLPTLEKLKRSDVTFSLLSNTAFVKGRTLRKMFKGLGLEGLFAFELFSDEAGLSKPNRAFFQLMLDQVSQTRGPIPLEAIVHIGDNPVADEAGARAMGIPAILINDNRPGIEHLLRLT
jgi:putative hydrolase of the HAD superfamily